jgi:hypothetical protein
MTKKTVLDRRVNQLKAFVIKENKKINLRKSERSA